MLWNVKTKGGRTPPELAAHVERRLHFALSRFAGRIRRVDVVLGDLNGPRGGIDKSCRIVARVRDGGDVVADVSDVGWEIAVDRATNRIGHSIGRELARRRAARRPSGGVTAGARGPDGPTSW